MNKGANIGVSNFPPKLMLQMDFQFFNVESICGFTSTFVAICYATSYIFGFISRSKKPPLETFKFLFNALRNKDKKVSFIRLYADGALARFSEFMRKRHNMNIIFQTNSGYESSLNRKGKIPNKTLDNIIRALMLNLSHKKELWCLDYQYTIWISCRAENMLCGDVP